jgi:hypothetical protein
MHKSAVPFFCVDGAWGARRREATGCPNVLPIALKINIFHYFRAPFWPYQAAFHADIVTVE